MCGIVGYVGPKEASPIVISGLKRLEYRGYDSSGLAALERGTTGQAKLRIIRAEGRLENLIQSLAAQPLVGNTSIGHTRWATHGRPSERNAHPHRYRDVVIVHNGIIENHQIIKERLKRKGHEFQSDTDSEVIAHLLQSQLDDGLDFETACEKTVNSLVGAFAIAAIWSREPSRLFVARQHCPMVLGLNADEKFIASDVPALLDFTKEFIFLEDGEMAFLEPTNIVIKDFAGRVVKRRSSRIEWTLREAEKEGYEHFMLKEIYEQPRAIRDTLREKILGSFDEIVFPGVKWKTADWKKVDFLQFVACGTAWHATLIGKYWIEQFSRTLVEADLASEFRYRSPVIPPRSLCIGVSQSGETADTLAAVKEAKRLRAPAVAVTNAVESSLARLTRSVIYTHAGLEISVASTKCFTSQLVVMALLAAKLAAAKKEVSKTWMKRFLKDLSEVPSKIEEVLKLNDQIKEAAKRYVDAQQYFYLGRGLSYPVALEGALKLKEIAYVNTQAYPAGEMKHGPIALISEAWPVMCVAPNDSILPKTSSNIEEVRARGGRLIIIGTEGNESLRSIAETWIGLPAIREEFTPFLTTTALQLFSYHMAVLRGCDVDKPRNLAKSVTVE